VKENLIVESVKQWRNLADECVEEIRDIVVSHVDQLVKEHFANHAHGGLLDAVT
jgi:mannose/cellobiose epimerase-like protein (N-acyl-D-glucosamine 2-epimerase family)